MHTTPEQTGQARAAWSKAIFLLGESGLGDQAARRAFGGLLAKHKIAAQDLLPALEAAEANGTMDAYPFLVKAAQRASERVHRQDPALSCSWS